MAEVLEPVVSVPVNGGELGEKSRNFWRSMTQSKISEKGIGLNFVTPTVVSGENVAKLDKTDVDRETESWQNALIVYVIGQNPSLVAKTNYCKSQWDPKIEPKNFKHDEGYFCGKNGDS